MCIRDSMRWGVPIKTKDATAEGLHALVHEVADPAGIGKMHCDGGAEFKDSLGDGASQEHV